MKLYHVDHTGANRKYYLAVLNYINRRESYGISVEIAPMSEFIIKGVPKGTDVLSYQTFPDESNTGKFNQAVISKADFQFHSFEGKKIIIDTNDCGDNDGFSRMPFSREMPRVKCYPTKWFLKNYNVVMISGVSGNPGIIPDEEERIIPISCKFGGKVPRYYGHTIRRFGIVRRER